MPLSKKKARANRGKKVGWPNKNLTQGDVTLVATVRVSADPDEQIAVVVVEESRGQVKYLVALDFLELP